MKTIKTYLPIFPGFYGTIFEPDLSDELYDQNWERDDTFPELDEDDLEFDYKAYQNVVGKWACYYVEQELPMFVSRITFEQVNSPREYNFRNDEIDIEVELDDDNIWNIKWFLNEHKEEFKEFLKEMFASRSGFISFFSTDFDDWSDYTDGFENFDDNPVHLGSILEFISRHQGLDQEVMWEHCFDSAQISEFTKNRTAQVKCEDCGTWYEAEHSDEHEEYERIKKTQLALWRESQGVEPSDVRTFEQLYPEFAWLCPDCKVSPSILDFNQ